MCDAFAEHGIKVELLYPWRDNTPEMAAVENVWRYYGLRERFTLTALPTSDILHRTEHLLGRFPSVLFRIGQRVAFNLLMRTYRRSLLRYLRDHTADVYYLRDWRTVWTLVRARPDLAARFVYEAHTFPRVGIDQQRIRATLSQIGEIVVITHHLKTLYSQTGVSPEKILVAPDGVDLARFRQVEATKQESRLRLGLSQERFVVGYVGRLHTLGQEKGVALLIEAISTLKQTDPSLGVALCCVGGPDEMAGQYQALADQLGLAPDDVVFVSQVPPTQVALYLNAFDVCAMPFPWTQHYAYYMSPLKLFEYMAAERPILATELPSVQEILQHERNAYLVPPDDAHALADGIRWLATHREAAQILARQARMDAEQYTWVKRAQRILAGVDNPGISDHEK